ncbi:hypothetical protein VNO77_43475 [Canavalia gladiata]|uniref:Uncharacterized protein n=1 Tax=Canavalia gladiata TaxID=3824 RepID=A0AAN9PPG8_CANGL
MYHTLCNFEFYLFIYFHYISIRSLNHQALKRTHLDRKFVKIRGPINHKTEQNSRRREECACINVFTLQ